MAQMVEDLIMHHLIKATTTNQTTTTTVDHATTLHTPTALNLQYTTTDLKACKATTNNRISTTNLVCNLIKTLNSAKTYLATPTTQATINNKYTNKKTITLQVTDTKISMTR